jgi:hypothetical protein
MEERFIPVNAALALYSLTNTSWPRPLADLGYFVESLELPINVGDGSRVVADVVGHRSTAHRFLLTEAKSGANVDEDQARRYGNADPVWLVQATRVKTNVPDLDPQVQTHYICMRGHEERILRGLAESGVDFPVLSVGESDIRHCGAAFDDADVTLAFASPLSVSGSPPGIITIDRESPDVDFDQRVAPAIVEFMSRRVQDVSVVDIAKSAIPHLDIYPTGYREALTKKVEQATKRAADADSQHLEFRPRTETRPYAMLRVKMNPEDLDPRGRTQAYQGISNRLGGSRRRPAAVNVNQGVLFEKGDLSLELSEDVEGEEGA